MRNNRDTVNYAVGHDSRLSVGTASSIQMSSEYQGRLSSRRKQSLPGPTTNRCHLCVVHLMMGVLPAIELITELITLMTMDDVEIILM